MHTGTRTCALGMAISTIRACTAYRETVCAVMVLMGASSSIRFDKGCINNLRNFALMNPDTRDREIEYGEGAITPLVDAELHTLLSGNRKNSTAVAMS
jgi:hypothetical protein